MIWRLFGKGRPKCPLSLAEKVWVETRLGWIIERCGWETIHRGQVILPTREFFPEPFDRTDAGLIRHFEIVCQRMGVDPAGITLTATEGREAERYSGLYVPGEPPEIRINRACYQDEEHLIAVLSHEIAHDLLLGRGLLEGNELDHEWITDLYPVYAGFGVFHANTAIKFRSEYAAGWSSWTMSKSGYIPARFVGYGMAVMGWLRSEESPTWPNAMTVDGRQAAREGLAYLHATNDCLISRKSAAVPSARWSTAQLLEELVAESPSRRLVALHAARELTEAPPELVVRLLSACRDDEPSIRGDALITLSHLLPGDAPELNEVAQGLFESEMYVRRSAALALGIARRRWGRPLPNEDEILRGFATILKETDRMLSEACIRALKHFGPTADALCPRVIRHLASALINHKETPIEQALIALDRIRPGIRDWLPTAMEQEAPHAVDQLAFALENPDCWSGPTSDEDWVDRLP